MTERCDYTPDELHALIRRHCPAGEVLSTERLMGAIREACAEAWAEADALRAEVRQLTEGHLVDQRRLSDLMRDLDDVHSLVALLRAGAAP